ncbi:hypothetical protein EYB53_004320 [Candidatus Chloroploca sp. M-50]|uniref:Uncharacterized protein n=1 Tax=Candidatus Chloroploca mongolica TaxID=2528176 RepID=A0ABS4D662_9CHLR|nr:hypothetical protein [Candidatus Chloroploca mongolica]MBP1464929.1 hypothetical protein [Candidatus Chloroploca mongolica]
MGFLAEYLQTMFKQQCPIGWTCHTEQRLLSETFERRMGYSSRVDVLFRHNDGRHAVWVEFEVSRADPVANHAKFLVAHARNSQLHHDTFISMVSPHVAYGRSHLAANMIFLMRKMGVQSFQTTLLPQFTAAQIKQLNALSIDLIQAYPDLYPDREVERVFTLIAPVVAMDQRRLHFVGNMLEVMLNIQTWNEQIHHVDAQAVWGKRTVLYFVYDPLTRTFAPSKFCGYLVLAADTESIHSGMTIPVYVDLDRNAPSFDGFRARTHLQKHLGMLLISNDDHPTIIRDFEQWHQGCHEQITVHPRGPNILVPPVWFRQTRH